MLLAGACSPTTSVWFGGDFHYGASSPVRLLGEIPDVFPGVPGVVNLEGAIAELGPTTLPSESAPVRLRNDAWLIPELPFVAVGVANNHAEDAEGAIPGSGVLALGGLPFGLAQVDLTRPPRDLAALLAEAWGDTSIRVAMFHVSDPPSYLPGPTLRAAVDAALAAGADLVVSHGSHVVGPVERRGGAGVVWGLGNLAFDCTCTDEREAILARATFRGGDLLELEIVPIEAGLGGHPARLSPDPRGVLDLLEALGSGPWVRSATAATLRW
jgi:hypothetical protein